MAVWRKRGRPKLDRPSQDGGTPELQARRTALVAGGDPTLAEYPLGIMLARGLISAEEHEAGCYYAMLYARAVARTSLSCAHIYRRMLAESGRSTALDDKSQEHVERLFRTGKGEVECSIHSGGTSFPGPYWPSIAAEQPVVAVQGFPHGSRAGRLRLGCSGRHQIQRAGGAEGRITVAPVGEPDARPVHLHAAIDQAFGRRDAFDARLAAVACAVGEAGLEAGGDRI